MWVNDNGLIVNPADVYKSIVNGNTYGRDWNKATIPELHLVTETERPTDPDLVVTGFTVDGSYNQVWTTRAKTSEELADDLAIAKTNKILELRNTYLSLRHADINLTFNSVEKAYQCDPYSLEEISKVLVSNPVETPNGFYWVAKDNSQTTPFLRADVQAFATAVSDRAVPLFQNYQDKKNSVLSETTIAGVNAITW